MAALHEEAILDPQECANCGATGELLQCSRCHTAWFCGVKCQKAYWPFHKTQCRRNEFADAIEESEPKFATWMRKHGKLAVLKDDEVDRLERATAASTGPRRDEVMESMYGRLEPKPKEPSFSAEEKARMHQQQLEEESAARARLGAPGGPSYDLLEIPQGLGIVCQGYKWRQTQTRVEVFIPLYHPLPAKKVDVVLSPTTLCITADERPLLSGTLYRDIKVDESAWFVMDAVLEIFLLKRSRKGNYADGETNAETYWRSLLQSAKPQEVLQLKHPPTVYYSTYWEGEGMEKQRLRSRKALPAGEIKAQRMITNG